MSSTRPMATGPESALVGRTLGPYRIEALLGRGGMSTVYRARQMTLDRRVALKLLPPEYTVDTTLVARFLQEARSAAALQHPNIIPIYDSGQVDGLYYIAMRYVEGAPLSRAIPEQGFPVARAVAIVEQIASALDYAHARGVVHRDVSAGNVMIEPGDRVTLMDFGIAQARQTSRLTRAGIAVGTLEYLSPEQARGELATPRSDVYALGVLAFELLSGRLPFSAADDRALLLQHLNTPAPSIRAGRPDIPAGIDAALQRCLAKDPAARFASAGAMVAALRAALAERSAQRTVVVPAAPSPQGSGENDVRRDRLAAGGGAAAGAARPARKVTQPGAAVPAARQPAKGGGKRPAVRRVRRKRRWLRPLLALVLLAALVGGALAAGQYAGQQGGINSPPGVANIGNRIAANSRSGASATHSASTAHTATSTAAASTTGGSSTAQPTAVPPAPVAVAPPEAGQAVQGFYNAVLAAVTKHDQGQFAVAYGYLTPQAQAKLPYAAFVDSFKSDRSIAWTYYAAQGDEKTKTVPVDLTEFRPGGDVTSSFAWVVVNEGAGGWHLDHQQQQAFGPQDTAPPNQGPAVPVVDGAGHGPGKGKGKGRGHGD